MKVLKRKTNPSEKKASLKEHAEKIVSKVEDKIDTENQSISDVSVEAVAEQTLKEAQEFITRNSDADKISELTNEEKDKAIDLLKIITELLVKKDNIPDEAAGEFIKNIIQNDSKIVGVKVAEQSPFLPDSSIKDIIETEELGVKEAETLVTGIDDTKTRINIQEKIDLEKLQYFYDNSDTMNQRIFVENLKNTWNSIENKTSKVNDLLNKTISKKIAQNILKFGSNKLSDFTEIMGPLQMLEIDLPEIVSSEYRKIKIDSNKSSDSHTYPYSIEEFKKSIIHSLGSAIAQQYMKQPASRRQLIIPDSDAIKSFNEEEENELIHAIQISCKNLNLKNYQLQDARNQIHDTIDTEEVVSLKSNLESIKNKDLRKNIANELNNIVNMINDVNDEDKPKLMNLISSMAEKSTKMVKEQEEKNEQQGQDI